MHHSEIPNIFTFKTARTETLVSDDELAGELMAQFLIQGQVRLNKSCDTVPVDQLNEFEKWCNAAITQILHEAVGLVLAD